MIESEIYNEDLQYIEPFCGMASVALEFAKDVDEGYSDRKITISDYSDDISKFWIAVKKDNIVYPKKMTGKKYDTLFESEPSPLKTFVGYSMSFGSIYYNYYRGNYQSDEKTQQDWNSAVNIMHNIQPLLKYIKVEKKKSYDEYKNLKNKLLYLDPPYEVGLNKTSNKYLSEFDIDKFWDISRKWSKNNLVFISEQDAPKDFKCIWSKQLKRPLQNKSNRNKSSSKKGNELSETKDKLFIHEDIYYDNIDVFNKLKNELKNIGS